MVERAPRHRRLTRFLCQELLYEYEAGRLTPPRKADVDDFLRDDYESARELDNLRKGSHYAETLAALELTAALAQALHAFEPRWKTKLQAWTLWSSTRGWRALPYVVTGACAVMLTLSYQPWRTPSDQTLAATTPTPMHLPVPPAAIGVVTDVLESANKPTSVETRTGVLAAQTVPAAEEAAGKVAREIASAAAGDVASEDALAKSEAAPTIVTGATGRAELWRGTLSVGTFSKNAPAIRAKILELGGKPAGAVDLGWLRGPGEAYFHLALPESNFAQLKTYLATFGPVRINREPHPRKMPPGQIRIILTVKDNGKDEREPASPAQSP